MKWKVIIIAIMGWLITACEDEPVLIFDAVPKIKIDSIAPTSIVEFADSIIIILEYEDGDGDLGYSDPDSFALEIQDTRLLSPDYYYVPLLAPEGVVVSITGTLRVALKTTFLIGNGAVETTTFRMRLKDRSGNWSNTLITPEITISPP